MAPKPAPAIPLPPSMPRAKNPHPGLPDQPRSRRTTEEVQAEKEKKASEKRQKEQRRQQAIQDAADYQKTSQTQQEKQMANALHPPETVTEKAVRPQRAAALAAKSGTQRATQGNPDSVSDDDEFVPGEDGEDAGAGASASDEEMLDPSDEESKAPAKEKPRKKPKKSSLRVEVEAIHGKSSPSDGNSKRKAEYDASSRGRKDQKKQKKIATGVRTDWNERSAPSQKDEDFDMYAESDADILIPLANDSDRRSRSASSGVSVRSSTSKPPTSDEENEISAPPFSDNEGEGEERTSMDGRAAKAEDLKGYYGGGSKAKAASKVRSLAKVIPTTSVPSFISPSISKKVASGRLKRENIRQSHLPLHLQNVFLQTFAPRLIELAGTLVAWAFPTDDQISDLWKEVFPAEPPIVKSSEMEMIVRKLSSDQISSWRNKFAAIALSTLQDIVFPLLPENSTATRANWCTWILGQSDDHQPPFYYREYTEAESEDGVEPKIIRKGPFQSTLISEVFGNAHLASIATIPLAERSSKRPIGALTYATQASKRALSFYVTGELRKPATAVAAGFSAANWGDHYDRIEGKEKLVPTTSQITDVIDLLENKQWEKILEAGTTAMHRRAKIRRAHAAAAAAAAAASTSASSRPKVILVDDDSE